MPSKSPFAPIRIGEVELPPETAQLLRQMVKRELRFVASRSNALERLDQLLTTPTTADAGDGDLWTAKDQERA